MSEREVYPNAPIVLVAVEVRYPKCEPLNRTQVFRLSKQVQKVLPLPNEASMVSVELQANPDGTASQRQTSVRFPRWMTRDKRTALSIKPDSLIVETTNYGRYEKLHDLLSIALRELIDIVTPVGVDRIGLRYVDEIRVPSESGVQPKWQEWVDPAVLGPVYVGSVCGLVPAGNEGAVVFSGPDGQTLVLRYGAQVDYAVPSTDLLRRPLPPPGPLFRLDIDSFWVPSIEVPEFDVNMILERVDDLHKPVRAVFEHLITDRLRKEVLRNA
ncbi:MAG: TIGR04255 family protein [Propionibacteriaceae bacterium]|nr:TIGR04255 family protein [Propionibacteriaceae bacterium]